jgi:hypothetical protein
MVPISQPVVNAFAAAFVLSLYLIPTAVWSAPYVDPSEVSSVIQTARPDSPLKDYGLAFVIYGLAYNVDPRLMVAISAAESTYGTDPCPRSWPDPEGKHNAWGWFWGGGGVCTNSPVYSWDGGIRGATKNVRFKTFQQKKVAKLDEFNGNYCTTQCDNWLKNACAALNRFRDTHGFCDETDHTSAAYANYTFGFQPDLLFSSDIDQGVTGWSATGFWHVVTSPDTVQVLSEIYNNLVTLGPQEDDRQLHLTYKPGHLAPAYSGNEVWWYGEESTGTYIGSDFRSVTQMPKGGGTSVQSNAGDLITPVIDLTGYRKAFLTFFTVWEIESVDANSFDILSEEIKIEVSSGGSSFRQVSVLNPPVDVNGPPDIPYVSGINIFEPFSVTKPRTPLWTPAGADLSTYAGQKIRIRFRFDTRDTLYNGFRGLLIDDVKVFGVR